MQHSLQWWQNLNTWEKPTLQPNFCFHRDTFAYYNLQITQMLLTWMFEHENVARIKLFDACVYIFVQRVCFLLWRKILGSDPSIGIWPQSAKQLCVDQFAIRITISLDSFTVTPPFVSSVCSDCASPCQCRLFLISRMLCRDKCQPVRAALSLPWRWWAACWSPSLLVVWSPMERGRSESLCTYSSSVKRQHSSC